MKEVPATAPHYQPLALSRRAFLPVLPLIPIVFANIACGRSQNPTAEVRRKEGEYSIDEVKKLANVMIATRLGYVAYAGNVLLDNQQGKNSFSKENTLFVDEPVKFGMVRTLERPAATLVTFTGTTSKMDIPSKSGGRSLPVNVPGKIKLDGIILGDNFLRDKSDFLIEFFIAKEIMTLKSAEMAVDFTSLVVYKDYSEPMNERLKQRVRAGLLNGAFLKGEGIGEISTMELADRLGHFILVPDYLLAKEAGKFSEKDMQLLKVFEASAKVFLKAGVLEKQDEKYVWTGDAYNAWMQLAIDPEWVE